MKAGRRFSSLVVLVGFGTGSGFSEVMGSGFALDLVGSGFFVVVVTVLVFVVGCGTTGIAERLESRTVSVTSCMMRNEIVDVEDGGWS
ncbi:predicted protein [Pyrenophora tritici-repentis Pt-1C-BFP]|uniref:Uncharacterized protein n=1 Tax=Pyrenophora tritici-repentis (strain Pt-1C-BFP) TaxID=426418 RepID=B2W742_PYRTR|nr:uncharacterized protein PTRG_05630 [Pyrenophora tritici-repentis Pt-1C-BFP]EDU48550.1 predicted protein [Pyrenophora tritici-repentis Pt-1C-BFP]